MSIRPSDLLVALVRKDGAIVAADLIGLVELNRAEVGAIGVAWSNAGDRLAVARYDPAAEQYTLTLMTPELVELASHAISVRADHSAHGVLVSWSADDSVVAVSNEPTFSEVPDPSAALVDVRTGDTTSLPFAGIVFTGPAEAAATQVLDSQQTRVVLIRISGLDVADIVDVAGALATVASVPAAGVFLTHEPGFGAYLDNLAGLRTADLGAEPLDTRMLVGAKTVLLPASATQGMLLDGWWWETENDLSAELEPSLRP